MNKQFKVVLITPVGTFQDSTLLKLYDQIKARDDAFSWCLSEFIGLCENHGFYNDDFDTFTVNVC